MSGSQCHSQQSEDSHQVLSHLLYIIESHLCFHLNFTNENKTKYMIILQLFTSPNLISIQNFRFVGDRLIYYQIQVGMKSQVTREGLLQSLERTFRSLFYFLILQSLLVSAAKKAKRNYLLSVCTASCNGIHNDCFLKL